MLMSFLVGPRIQQLAKVKSERKIYFANQTFRVFLARNMLKT